MATQWKEPGVREVCTLEPKHLTGKDGVGKGSQRRHGYNDKLYSAEWDRIFGGTKTAPSEES